MANSHTSGKKKTTIAGVAIAILIAIYSLARPSINDATGWSLPAITQTSSTPATVPAKPSPPQPKTQRSTNPPRSNQQQSEQARTATPEPTRPQGPLADAMSDAKTKTQSEDSAPPGDASLKYGSLREIGRDRYISPAGLLYTPGSAEGHRLEHLRRHTEDQPARPGKHGVFDGGMEGALKTIDQAYENAKTGKRTTKHTDEGRTIYTVDMGKRIGFVGGREGNQRHKPMARRVQIVLDGNRFITAYPL